MKFLDELRRTFDDAPYEGAALILVLAIAAVVMAVLIAALIWVFPVVLIPAAILALAYLWCVRWLKGSRRAPR